MKVIYWPTTKGHKIIDITSKERITPNSWWQTYIIQTILWEETKIVFKNTIKSKCEKEQYHHYDDREPEL